MRRTGFLKTSVALAALAGVSALATPAFAADVTWERLLNPEPENWLSYSGNLSGWRYSPLDQINKDNVGDLEVAYMFSIGGRATGGTLGCTEEGAILAVDGNLITVDCWARIMRFDVSSGNAAVPLWRYDPEITKARTQRGVALLDDGVFIGTNDTRMVRVDADTGEVVWEVVATAPTDPTYGTPSPDTQGFTTEPIALHSAAGKNVVIQGESTGGQQGTISYVAAWDADNGDFMWRWYAIPFPGEPGHETWEDDHEAWRTGGGGVWSHPTFDPATNLVYHGTGDAFPTFDPQFRPGDNLFTASTVALDADTGALVWYVQHVPNEQWDFDQPATRMLIDGPDGTPAAAQFGRGGFLYVMNRTNGAMINATGYTPVNWTAGVDAKTGLPIDYVPGAGVQQYAGVGPRRGETTGDSCPTWSNGPQATNPSSFDPVRRVFYLQFAEGCLGGASLTAWPDEEATRAANGLNRIGQGAGATVQRTPPAVRPVYTILAVDADTGERLAVWADPTESVQAYTGVTNTAGGLAIAGTSTGDVQFFDADTLEMLFNFNVGAEVSAPPSTWSVNGTQYVGMIVGGNGNGLYQRSAMGVVFALGD